MELQTISSILLLFCILSVGTSSSEGKVETTEPSVILAVRNGKISGTILTSREGGSYWAFKGIPFGKVETRFEAPIPAPGWNGVLDTSKYGPMCPQFERKSRSVFGEEDCLFLNVFAPEFTDSRDKLIPVVVFIHGGAFQFGTGSDYDGGHFPDEEVILVTFNYRLGALGFLSSGDGVIQGNAGLKDQTLALQWVQENIEFFGGDKGRVTLMGTSAGGGSVSLHLLSPGSRNLFHRAESTSASALNPWTINPNPRKFAAELAENVNCPTKSSEAMAQCLRRADFKKVTEILLSKWHMDPLVQFGPVVETLRPGQSESDVFLSEDPYTLLSEGRFHKVPVIMGVVADEGLLFHSAAIMKNPELLRNLNEDWNSIAPVTFLYGFLPHMTKGVEVEVSRKVRGFYFGEKLVSVETFQNLTNLYSDVYFNHGVKNAALLMAKHTPVYPFILGFTGGWSFVMSSYGYEAPVGVCHGDDLQYVFDSPRFPNLKPGSKEMTFSKQFVKVLASFAKTGNVMESVDTFKTPWLPISPDEIKRNRIKWYLLDSPQAKVLVREPFTERLDFWDKITAQLDALRPMKDQQGSLRKDEL